MPSPSPELSVAADDGDVIRRHAEDLEHDEVRQLPRQLRHDLGAPVVEPFGDEAAHEVAEERFEAATRRGPNAAWAMRLVRVWAGGRRWSVSGSTGTRPRPGPGRRVGTAR
jgi:hypothetical protein